MTFRVLGLATPLALALGACADAPAGWSDGDTPGACLREPCDSAPNCITPSTTKLALEEACAAGATTLRLENTCAVAVEMEHAYIDGDDGFTATHPPLPRAVEPGGFVEFVLQHLPRTCDPGPVLASLIMEVADAPHIRVPLEAGGPPTEDRSDRFVVGDRPRLDVLFVVDDLVGGTFEGRLAELAQDLVEVWMLGDVDFRAMVASAFVSDRCAPAGQLLPMDGSRPRVVGPATPDAAGVLGQNLLATTCSSAHELNRGLDAAWAALDPAADASLRDEAALAIVFVAARDDTSSIEVEEALRDFRSLKGLERPADLLVHAIAPDGCDAMAMPDAARYLAIVNEQRGYVQSICATAWTRLLGLEFVWTGPRMEREYRLSAEPFDENGNGRIDLPEEVTVRIDGVELPAFGADGQQRWSYDPEGFRIEFAESGRPAYGAEVEVLYRICGSCSVAAEAH